MLLDRCRSGSDDEGEISAAKPRVAVRVTQSPWLNATRVSPISSAGELWSLHHNYRLNSTGIASTRPRVRATPSDRNGLIASFTERYFFTPRREVVEDVTSASPAVFPIFFFFFRIRIHSRVVPSSNRGSVIHTAADTTLDYARILIDHTSTDDCPSELLRLRTRESSPSQERRVRRSPGFRRRFQLCRLCRLYRFQ